MTFDYVSANKLAVQTINDISEAMPSPKIFKLVKGKASEIKSLIEAAETKADRALRNKDMTGLNAALAEYKRYWLEAIKLFSV